MSCRAVTNEKPGIIISIPRLVWEDNIVMMQHTSAEEYYNFIW